MKINVKGLVFVGAAAAIMLSAGGAYATATKTQHAEGNATQVTSQKYTEATYEHWADKVADVADLSSGQENSPDLYPSMNVLSQTVDAALQNNIDDGVYVEATYADGDTTVDVKSAKLIDDGTSGFGASGVTIANSTANTGSGSELVVGTEHNLVTAKAVKDYAQTKSTNAHKISNGTGGWESLSTGVIEPTNGGYVNIEAEQVNSVATGKIILDIDEDKITTVGASSTANVVDIDDVTGSSHTNAGNLTTAWAVKDYVTTVLGGETLPEMNPLCKVANTHCALVTSWDATLNGGTGGITCKLNTIKSFQKQAYAWTLWC